MDKNIETQQAMQIANIIKGLKPSVVYRVFNQAQKINTDESRRESYTKLFQEQIGIAQKSGFSSNIVYFLQKQEEQVIEHALTLSYEPEETIFVPVVPLNLMDEDFQISLLEMDGKFGRKLNQDKIKDLVRFPQDPYYIKPYYIFRIGDEIVDTKVPDARKLIERTGRRPMNVPEGIALSLYDKNALMRHNIELALSVSARDEHSVWSISLRDGKPILGISPDTSFSKSYGIFSCERAVVAEGNYFKN
ncbi:MAG: hypothetical protein WC697_04470 [Patescibacteria group bacterium]|jgi:hypothetical protein